MQLSRPVVPIQFCFKTYILQRTLNGNPTQYQNLLYKRFIIQTRTRINLKKSDINIYWLIWNWFLTHVCVSANQLRNTDLDYNQVAMLC